ncbi:chloramphenicol acetyltransferase [Labilibacter marinus]|uniref:chloramphenicol acetyltransferase n=1 Tax=Labilibacter marinus TaxID=1477105 RepID=UPI00083503DB|nr:chloramphenicol acetyltransferase [Labilibacter marinus]
MKQINLNTWNRKEHFDFFSQFKEPFFGIVADVDCTKAYESVKNAGISFYAWYMHKSLLAVNTIPEFKCRIINQQPMVYDEVHVAGTTIRDDETFGFTFVPYSSDFNTFQNNLKSESQRVKVSSGLGLNDNTARVDVIHYSTLPWINFSSLTHARSGVHPDSIPKITFGKAVLKNGIMMLPVAINVHHALMDGIHVNKFLEKFEELLNDV